jgi:hypothetical protein
MLAIQSLRLPRSSEAWFGIAVAVQPLPTCNNAEIGANGNPHILHSPLGYESAMSRKQTAIGVDSHSTWKK